MRFRLSIPALLLIFYLPAAVQAQTLTNGQILADIGASSLIGSDLWDGAGERIILQAELPSPLKARLVSRLINSGRQISIDEGDGERIRMEWTTSNRLERIDGNTARRKLEGSVSVYLISGDQTVLGTEVIPFNYEDSVDAADAESLAGNWTAERFRLVEMEKRPGLWRRIAEPAVVIVATGVTVFLLYNVRSQ
ncbi:MAG: hypothetical protein LC662_08055 [Rhodothermaceae bacterium]|nr:hypothetical protein [Rhodothermaceae bacterium]